MALSDTEIDEFMRIYKEEIGKDISRAEVSDLAHRFLAGFRAVYRPIPLDTGDAGNLSIIK